MYSALGEGGRVCYAQEKEGRVHSVHWRKECTLYRWKRRDVLCEIGQGGGMGAGGGGVYYMQVGREGELFTGREGRGELFTGGEGRGELCTGGEGRVNCLQEGKGGVNCLQEGKGGVNYLQEGKGG